MMMVENRNQFLDTYLHIKSNNKGSNKMSAAVNIRIANRNDFPCPIGRTVEAVTNAIHSGYGLLNGFIKRNGVAMFPDEIVTADGDYEFVNFQDQTGMCLILIV